MDCSNIISFCLCILIAWFFDIKGLACSLLGYMLIIPYLEVGYIVKVLGCNLGRHTVLPSYDPYQCHKQEQSLIKYYLVINLEYRSD